MRPVISAAEAKNYLDNISGISAEPFRSRDHKETANHYGEMLNTHDCMQYLQLLGIVPAIAAIFLGSLPLFWVGALMIFERTFSKV